jgi:hypothetical protein
MTALTGVMPLSVALREFLGVLGCGGRGLVALRAWSRSGIGFERLSLRVEKPPPVVPEPLLGLLESHQHIVFGVAARDEADQALVALPAVFARFETAPELVGSTWCVPAATLAHVDAQLTGFPLAPTVVIDAIATVTALWAFDVPLDLGQEPDRARTLQQRLVARVSASTDEVTYTIPTTTLGPATVQTIRADDLSMFVPLPGGIVRDCGSPPPVVVFRTLELERRYAIDQVERAIVEPTAAASRRSELSRGPARAETRKERPA